MSIWVAGEALIDLLPAAVVGGGPANTARALAKLGHSVEFIDGISRDSYGISIRKVLSKDGVSVKLCLDSAKPTCTALVTLAENGSASYEFSIDETATFDFSPEWLPDPSRHKPNLLHVGTLATIIQPGADALHSWALTVAEFAPLVFDPNIRSSVISDRDLYEAAVEKWVAISTVVKVSEEDLGWLFPSAAIADVAQRWIEDGVALVLITRAAEGMIAYTADESIAVAGVKVAVVDTVGAGDTVGAILVEAILAHGVLQLRGDLLREVLDCAATAAAITCSRAGAQPPTRAELDAALENRITAGERG